MFFIFGIIITVAFAILIHELGHHVMATYLKGEIKWSLKGFRPVFEYKTNYVYDTTLEYNLVGIAGFLAEFLFIAIIAAFINPLMAFYVPIRLAQYVYMNRHSEYNDFYLIARKK